MNGPEMTDLRYDLATYLDLYAKLKRDVARFVAEPSGDHLFNAMVTAWCLADWLVVDLGPTATPEMLLGLRALSGKAPGQRSRDYQHLADPMKMCSDIAEASKHGGLDRKTRIVSDVVPTDGTYGSGIYGFGRYGETRRRYAVIAGGKMHDAEDVLSEVLALYDGFLTEHGLLSEVSTGD